MTLISLKDIINCDDYYIDDQTFQIVSFKQKKYENGKILKPKIDKDGYIRYQFYVNGKQKNIYLHHIIVKLFIDKNFDPSKNDIDHKNHNKQDNSIDNLCIVSRSENNRNISKSWNGKEFNFIDNIGKSLVINEEADIYYSLDLDKFYMLINHTGKYKELHMCLISGYPYIQYQYNNKKHYISINKFKKSLKQQ
ncbi:MAG: HNH endonuclease signature motif containing protein [Candidatus Onthovivens sp.]|nr:HNH endonuclease signature motif containing protein [Candidatus Onthovivens sp.]